MDRLDLWGSWHHLQRGQWTEGSLCLQARLPGRNQHPCPWSPRTFPPSPAQASPHLLRHPIHAPGHLSSRDPGTGHALSPVVGLPHGRCVVTRACPTLESSRTPSAYKATHLGHSSTKARQAWTSPSHLGGKGKNQCRAGLSWSQVQG